MKKEDEEKSRHVERGRCRLSPRWSGSVARKLSLHLSFHLNNCILMSPHVANGGYIFVSFLCFDRRLRLRCCFFLLNFFEMSHHFDGTSFSPVLYAILHVKRVKNWHTSHQCNKHSIHYPHKRNPCHSGSCLFFSVSLLLHILTYFHSLRRQRSVLWCNSTSATSTLSNKIKTNITKNNTNKNNFNERKKQTHNFVWNADWVNEISNQPTAPAWTCQENKNVE